MAKWVSVAAMGVAAIGCGFLAACSPFGGGAFSCERDDQCGAGKCTSGYCSFADASCDSGYRFGTASGSLANTCVGGAGTDGGLDSKMFEDAPPPGVTCFGTGFGKTCFADADVPSQTAALSGAIDTDGAMCATNVVGTPAWCVIAGTDVTVGAITVTGSKPLVLVATGTLAIDSIDIASHLTPPKIGAGSVPIADTTLCDPGTPPDTNSGGAGGSFGVIGGAGGNGNGNTGGVPGAIKPAGAIRGGCAGQDGKTGGFGIKGLGGGALYLIAKTKIVVTGTVNASGAAASGANNNKGGGGGGGSGGFIGLDSPIVMNTGAIFANGGGGGEGATNGTSGNDGKEATTTALAGASGNKSMGGDGGGGGAAGGTAGNDGGGGGGGGLGAIVLFQATAIAGNAASPPPG